MTHEFCYLLHLAGASATGVIPSEPHVAIDWEVVYRLAKQQTVEHLVAYTLKKNPALSCSSEFRQKLHKEMRVAVTVNSVRTHGMLQLMDEMRADGFRPILLKGCSLAPYYAGKACRISTDTDIWIDPKDEARAYSFLRAKGFRVDERAKTGHHAVCYHLDLGILELHTLLYDEIVEEVWFGKNDGREFVQESFERINTEDGSYETLGYTDYLLFLALHLVKHFIISGISIRMILDIAVFFSWNKERIDLKRFWDTLGSLRYTKLVNCVLWAAIRYCGFSAEDFPGLGDGGSEQVEMVLEDLEQGGWLGGNEKEKRNAGKREYNRHLMMKEKSGLEYHLSMLGWEYGNIRLLFPGKTSMIEKYPYLKRTLWLMPVAWLHRLFVRGTRAVLNGALVPKWLGKSKNVSPEENQRVELFRRLDMM